MTSGTPRDRLLHIADLHFWEVVRNPLRLLNKRLLGNANVWLRRRHEFRMERAAEFAEAAAGTGIRTALLTGDFSSTSTPAEFALARAFVDGLAERGITVHLLPGNHDVYTFESQRKRRFETHFAPFLPPGGYPARVDLPGGTPLVLIPTVRANWLSSRGGIRRHELEKVRELLEECPPGPVLAAGHYPYLHRAPGYRSGWSRQLANAEALRAVLAESGREILYVAGHVHRFSHARDPEWPNLRCLTIPPLFLQRHGETACGAFAEIHVERDGTAVYRHDRTDGWRRQRAECQDFTA